MRESQAGVPKASPAQSGAGHTTAPVGGSRAPYDPADPTFDSQRIRALGHLVKAIANAGPAAQGEGPWAHLCAFHVPGRGYAVELVFPIRSGMGTYYSTSALMDPSWDGHDAQYYDDPETAVRAVLDDVCFRTWGPRPALVREPSPKAEPRAPRAAAFGGDERF